MNAMFPIVSSVPLPERRYHVYPFGKMQVGDSFDVPRDRGYAKDGKDRRAISVKSAACHHSRKYGGKFTVRLVDENTIRCWRVA